MSNTNTKTQFMAIVQLSGLTSQQIVETMPHEDQVVRELMDEGVIQALHVRADLGGAFILGTAESAEAYDAYLKRLPLHPHMTIEFVPLFAMPEF